MDVDDLGCPTIRGEEVIDSETEMDDGVDETSESMGRVGVDSFCPMGFTVRVVGLGARVVCLCKIAEEATVDFAVFLITAAFVIVLSNDPWLSSGERPKSN